MPTNVTLELDEEILRSIESQIEDDTRFKSPSDYIRFLILDDQRKWDALCKELRPGMEADESEFVPFDREAIMARYRKKNEN